ncbi:MAG TPA: hypothetical protein VMZ91_05250 [Candidatus Paceibacterota bacterium]|nr:hypothetical protein [Candidatus Paceibacterota bacterium]
MKSIFKQEWKVVECGTQDKCWCRVIVLKSLKKYDFNDENNEDSIVVGPGMIESKFAKYVVKLHNVEIKRKLIGEVK